MLDRYYKGNRLEKFVSDYVVVDVETTGLNVNKCALIEVAAVKVVGDKVVDTFESLVKPYEYCSVSKEITELTGITNAMLREAPKIEDVLPIFKDFIGNSVLLGHNVNFDINVLYDNFERVLDSALSNDFVDTMCIAKSLLNLKHNRLSDVAKQLGVVPNGAHRALADCMTTYECYKILKSGNFSRDCTVVNRGTEDEPKKKISAFGPRAVDIEAESGCADESSIFYNKVCVITGELEKMSRNDVMQLIANIGGTLADSVTRKTNILIIGNEQGKGVKGGKSNKQKKAEELIEKGFPIKIVTEQEFYTLIEQSEKREKEGKLLVDSEVIPSVPLVSNILYEIKDKSTFTADISMFMGKKRES